MLESGALLMMLCFSELLAGVALFAGVRGAGEAVLATTFLEPGRELALLGVTGTDCACAELLGTAASAALAGEAWLGWAGSGELIAQKITVNVHRNNPEIERKINLEA